METTVKVIDDSTVNTPVNDPVEEVPREDDDADDDNEEESNAAVNDSLTLEDLETSRGSTSSSETATTNTGISFLSMDGPSSSYALRCAYSWFLRLRHFI